ncbi:hypothetical protein CBL_05508 [Carabus blaptoides fortunei]
MDGHTDTDPSHVTPHPTVGFRCGAGIVTSRGSTLVKHGAAGDGCDVSPGTLIYWVIDGSNHGILNLSSRRTPAPPVASLADVYRNLQLTGTHRNVMRAREVVS